MKRYQYQEELEIYKSDFDALRLKFPLTEEERARYKPLPTQKGPIKIRDVKIYEPKSETELLKDEALKAPQHARTLQTEPKKRSVALEAVLKEEASPNVHDEIAELRREIEALKKAQKS